MAYKGGDRGSSPAVTLTGPAQLHLHSRGQLYCATQAQCCALRAGPVIPNAAQSEGQGQLYANLSSLLLVVIGAIDINKSTETLAAIGPQTQTWSLAAAEARKKPCPWVAAASYSDLHGPGRVSTLTY